MLPWTIKHGSSGDSLGFRSWHGMNGCFFLPRRLCIVWVWVNENWVLLRGSGEPSLFLMSLSALLDKLPRLTLPPLPRSISIMQPMSTIDYSALLGLLLVMLGKDATICPTFRCCLRSCISVHIKRLRCDATCYSLTADLYATGSSRP